MQATTVTRVLVWSRWLRLSHWGTALSTIGLCITGLLMRSDLPISSAINDLHNIFGGVLLPFLLLRLYLLFFGKGTDHLSDCEPDMHRLSQAWQVARYYLTLGKAPLPKWYSHNPLWGPLYLVLFFTLFLAVVSGLMLLNGILFFAGIALTDLHQLCYLIVAIFTLLHIPAVFFHDLSGQAADISGMINGHRIFDAAANQLAQKPGEQVIPLDALLKTHKK
jgi:Ni/Fe-hydrogenase 1 B-type cytochrome subunit